MAHGSTKLSVVFPREKVLHLLRRKSVAGLAGKNLYKVKPKLHLFCELCCCCKSNPSSSWCYRDEDYAGLARRQEFR